ncbi:hypothetical protein [Kitasatospora sp. NPDC002965]|uniref:hypothetical protein n=1 Tax=Kitasatospora sp. NPDC002965 TaxID=3154775 RepID=UPI0033B512B5
MSSTAWPVPTALDFVGEVREILPQPLRLTFGNGDGQRREHTPDFLVLTRAPQRSR